MDSSKDDGVLYPCSPLRNFPFSVHGRYDDEDSREFKKIVQDAKYFPEMQYIVHLMTSMMMVVFGMLSDFTFTRRML